MRQKTHMLRVDQLDRKIEAIRNASFEGKLAPRSGWIRAIREAMGMTARDLGERMNISQPATTKLEKRERDKTISLAALQKAAQALDAELIYAIVPRDRIRDILERRAMEKARERIMPLAQSMSLESQSTSDERFAEEVKSLARDLLERPRELWR